MAPLGVDYQAVIQRAFDQRWIDLLPTEGKRSGAYSNGGAYDVHPYMLINYNGQYDDVSTLAHELGHTMQSYLRTRRSPSRLASYPMFVAEVASTFNESLLIDYMLKSRSRTTTRGCRCSATTSRASRDGLPPDAVRRVRAADARDGAEGRAHHRRRAGRALYGHHEALLRPRSGVCVVDDYVAHEWSYIRHFYRDFYVFQYATSFTASASAGRESEGRRRRGDRALPRVPRRRALKYPIDLLKDAGVDMTTDEPLDLTMKEMNRVMDEMEQILARKR